MNEKQKDLVKILKAYASGINGIPLGYYATVDVSGDVPQLCIH